MRTTLKISILLNLAALGGLVFFMVAGRTTNLAPAVSPPLAMDLNTSNLTLKFSTAGPVTPANLPPAGPPAFCWRQLDAKDYHVYVKNLRAIGCPEPTLRAIVTADVDSVYQNYGRELEQKLSGLENSAWPTQLNSFSSEQALKDALQKIPDEEALKIADLLGLQPAPVVAASPHGKPVSVPLAFQSVDLSALNLNEDQRRLIASLRQDFLQQIGGANQDPNDPAYLARWQKAQPEMDNILKSMIGTSAFQNYQLQAANNAHVEAAGRP